MQLKNLKQGVYFILSIILFTSCQPQEITYLKGSLNDAFARAQKEDKYLFVIASKEGCEACGKFISKTLGSDTVLKSKVLDDFFVYKCNIDVKGNEYLANVFRSIASPTSYIFNSKGELLNMITGYQKPDKVIEAIEVVQKNQPVADRLGSNLELDGAELIAFSNKVLKAFFIYQSNTDDKTKINQGIAELQQTLFQKSYFFNNYLLAKLYQRKGYAVQAKEFATEALAFNEGFDMYLYESLRTELKYVVDKNYSSSTEAHVMFDKITYDFGKVRVNERPKAVLKFKNTGNQPLIMHQVQGSCGCLGLNWTKESVLPGKEGKIEVSYDADHQGGFFKTLKVFSNAANAVVTLNLKGIVE